MLLKVSNHDNKWMRHALRLAKFAADRGEIPVGTVIVQGDHCIAEGWNQSIINNDPTAHAEIVALRKAAQHLNNYRLVDTTLYVTLEPCIMCAGAIIQARVKRVVFGAYDLKAGAAGSRFDILRDTRHNHLVECVSGLLADECREYLTNFFKTLRKNQF
ncbi:tRNA adenosine(34) deaminase TadA [Candidatus Parabeggiatoa sp. HSG14]|uniref:tRNA adenosine(34) deaminase TadA n=1 Tax=Candidatus Parabeggiatoa sp. HSG14 TaxID=3055593 RepID=UPI0025A6C2DB|nr:tRNA adenosine(34) deaminase TadA [Thiotrichales bacterium HSG14]